MFKETQTPKQKETEGIRGKWRKNSLRNMGIMVLSIPILIAGAAYTGLKSRKITPEKNPVVDQYNEARNTLSHLNSRLRTLDQQDLSYVPENLDEELQYVFIPPRQDLERAVQVVENDIQTIEDTSDALRNYNELVDIADEFKGKGIIYTIIAALGLCSFGAFNQSRMNKAKGKNLEEVDEKYSHSNSQPSFSPPIQ